MRSELVAVVLLIGACAPDVRDTAFRCDTDRGGKRGCPAEQSCEYGRCRRGGAVGEVACGAGGTCTIEQQCCVDGEELARCIPAGDACLGPSALCDGPSDCAEGDACCGGDTVACGATCLESVCVTDDDCPSAEPHCCAAAASVPWRICAESSC